MFSYLKTGEKKGVNSHEKNYHAKKYEHIAMWSNRMSIVTNCKQWVFDQMTFYFDF